MGCSASVKRVSHEGAAHEAALKALSQVVPSSDEISVPADPPHAGASHVRRSFCKHPEMREARPAPKEDMRASSLQEDEDEDEVRDAAKDDHIGSAARVTSARQLMNWSSATSVPW